MSKKTLLFLTCFILIAFAAETSLQQTDDASVRCPTAPVMNKMVNMEFETAETDAAIWNPEIQITNNGLSNYTYYSNMHNVVAELSGRVHVVWMDGTSPYNVHYIRYTPGFGWSNDTMFAVSGETYQRYPAIALDSSGMIHVVYGAGSSTSANYRVYYKSCLPVGTGNDGWNADTLLSNTLTTNYKYYPNVACSPNGNVHVVWREYNSSSPYYYRVAYLEKIGGTWQTQVNLDSSSVSLYDYKYYPCVAAGRDNNVHLTWYGYWAGTSPYAIIYKARIGGVWQASERVDPVSGQSQYNPTIAVNNLTNEPHIVWRAYPSPYYIVHSRRTSGAWNTVPDTITPYGGTTIYSYMPQISNGPGGKMHVVWYGYTPITTTTYQISYSERSASGSWSYPVPITNGAASTYRYYPSVTVNDSDYIHAVWYDNRSGAYEIWYVKGNPPLAYDVGVDRVYSPPAVMGPNTSYSPEGRVTNYGANAASSVPVYCQIDSVGTQIYSSNLTITGPIAPGDTARTGLFTSWTSGDYGTGYLVRMFTSWGSDLNNANDTMYTPLYIPALQWSQIPDLPAARYRCAGAGDTFGNFWVAGGWANSSVANDLYKFSGSSWTSMANMPAVNSNFCAVWNPADNCIYTVGGYDGSVAYNVFWRYHVDGDSWHALTNVPLSGYGYTAAIVGDSLYALYGVTLMVYSISNGTWSFGPSKPLGNTSGHGGMCALNGVVYHAGGWTADAYFYSYTPGTGWTRLADLPVGRQGLGLCAMDGKIYMVGGGSSWSLVPQPWVYVYNPSDPGLGWAVENNCLGAGTYAGAYGTVTLGGYSRIYACGGLDVSSNRLTYSQRAGFPFATDVGVAQILSPSGLLGTGTHTPQARIKNYGTGAVGSFTVRLDISPGGYSNTQTVTSLSSGDSIDVTFADWTVSAGGFYTVSCTTNLTGDQELINDMMTDAFGVYNYSEDFENAGTFTPNPSSGAWEWGDPVGGPGSSPDDTLCWATNITGSYNASSNWMLNSITYYATQNNPILAYWHWYENESYWDGYNVKVSTDGGSSWTLIHALPGYGQPYDQITSSANAGIPSESAYSYLDRTWRLNFMEVPVSFGDSFMLRWHFGSDGSVQYWGTAIDFVCGIGFDTLFPINRDVAIWTINEPTGNVDTLNYQFPQATVYNYGEQAETFDVTMDITGPVSFSYSNTQTVTALPPLTSFDVDFDSVKFNEIGTHNVAVYVSTPVSGDSNPSNDSMFGTFEGVPFVPQAPWAPMADVPSAPSGKNPKSGSCMAGLEATGLIYFLKASNKADFYSYDPATNVFTAIDTMPKGEKGTDYSDGKYPKRGAAMAAYEPGKRVYVVRGNNRLGFWKYQCDTLGDTMPGWSKLATIPTGAKRCKYGTGLAHVTKGGKDMLFLLKGAKTSEVYLYDIEANTWSPVTDVPTGMSGRAGYKKGSCIAYDGSEYVYILQGYYGSFFRYKVEADSFAEMKWYDYKTYVNRDGKKKKPKDGASLVYYDDNIYMLKGGNTVEVWKYDIAANDWSQMGPADIWDIPLGPTGRKKVKDGGGMIHFGDYFWASKGKNTPEFYRHVLPSPVAYTIPKPTNDGVMGSTVKTDVFKLTIAPNPATNLTAIRYNLPVAGPVTFKLYNITGALVKSHTITNPTKDGVLTLDAKSLPAGVYMLRFNSGEIKVTRKLVLEK